MTAFNYSTGNPANLIAGGGASMSDLQGSLNDVKTFLNSGTIDETNVPNLSAAFTTWKPLVISGTLPGSGIVTGAGTFLMPPGFSTGPPAVGAAGTGPYAFRFDPADFLANSRTTKLRVTWQFIAGAVAPGITFTCGLFPVASYVASSGVQMSVATLSSVVAGSTAAFTTPGAGTNTVTASSEFNAPSAADYVLGFTSSGAMAAGSQATLRAQLQMRQV